MIDELNTVIEITPPPEVKSQVKSPFDYHDIKFFPRYHENGIITYYGMLENLKLNFYFDKLHIKNSWHKYLLRNNYSDYRYTDIEETFYKIESKLHLNFERARITKIAYGCVINENPILSYPYWMYIKNRRPQPMTSNGKLYGSMFVFNDYRIKGYDKKLEVWRHDKEIIGGHHFRVEKEVKYMRHLRKRTEPINLVYLGDLFNKNILNQLTDDLILTYQTIEKQPNMNNLDLSLKDMQVMAIMKDEPFRARLKNEHPKTYKNYRKRFKELSEAENGPYFDEVGDRLREKMKKLINS